MQAILSSRRARAKSSDKRRSKVSINLRQRAKKAVRRENLIPMEETGTNLKRLLKYGQCDDQKLIPAEDNRKRYQKR